MAKAQRHPTKYPGVFYREARRIASKAGETERVVLHRLQKRRKGL